VALPPGMKLDANVLRPSADMMRQVQRMTFVEGNVQQEHRDVKMEKRRQGQ
jgi:hypothetical protein